MSEAPAASSSTLRGGNFGTAIRPLLAAFILLTNYYTFYLIEKFGMTIRESQLLLFVFLGTVAAGTVIGGLFFGFAGIGAALLGELADIKGIEFVYHLCAYLPAFGILTMFLPDIEKRKAA
jgi:MFS transporter, FSR family, fosmidomycin resistance protein